MALREFSATFAVAAMVWLGAAGPAAAAERPAFVLRIDDRADVSPSDLAGAKREIHRIFDEAGVEVIWRQAIGGGSGTEETPASPRPPVTVTLVKITNDSKAGTAGCALGLALTARDAAYVFVNRIVEATRMRPVDLSVILGRVIAHEIGHVLLPHARHSNYGLMRADLDFGTSNPNRFTGDEVRMIREALVIRRARK